MARPVAIKSEATNLNVLDHRALFWRQLFNKLAKTWVVERVAKCVAAVIDKEGFPPHSFAGQGE